MRRAVILAERGRRTTAPNPWVGSIIVDEDGETALAEGYHVKAGGPHAEAAALADAASKGVPADALRRATMYVTLEPCHAGPGKRTPPCDEAIIASGIRRVVVAQADPDPDFGGAGVEALRIAGVEVTVGAGAALAAASLEPYLHQRRHRRPFCVVKTAVSIDGAVACADGSSRWITGPEARAEAHRLRALSQAVVVGSGTALRDEPQLTVRAEGMPWATEGCDGAEPLVPLRVVLDSAGLVTAGPLMEQKDAPTLMLTTAAGQEAAGAAWDRAGVEHEAVGVRPGGGLDLRAVVESLGRRRVMQAMFEGGPTLHGSLLAAGLADQLHVYVGNCLLGSTALPWARAPIAATIADKQEWSLRSADVFGQDARLIYARATTDG